MPAAAITFVVTGQVPAQRSAGAAPPVPAGGLPGTVKASVRLGARRAAGDTVRLNAVPGEDVVVLHLANGPALVLHPETARDLLLGQGARQRSAGLPGEVVVPAQLRWSGLEQAAPARTRGFLGDVLLQAVEVLTGFAKDKAADFVAGQVVAKLDGQVRAGVYALVPETLAALKEHGQRLDRVPAADGPLLVLLHGTFVDTASTFAKLWALHPGSVRSLFEHYGRRVYALDHPTVGASPIANALTLAQALPTGARLHLVTHSRGGLVAEVLARVGAQRGVLTPADLAPFAGAAYAGQRQELQALAALVKARDIRVERVVRIACPARGTLLASRRLDAYLSVLKWSLELAAVPVAPALLDFLTEVARRREDPMKLPGLAAMVPDSPLVHWLNGAEQAIAGDLRVIAGDLEGDSLGSWVKTLLADAFYWTDNDIVVQTRSMYGGAPRSGGASFLLDQGGKVTHFNYFANLRTASAVVDALVKDQPPGFRPIGPLSWAGEDSSGLRAARMPRAGEPPAAERPAVFLLPGILGSHLKDGDQRIWLSLRLIGGLDRLAYRPGGADPVQPDGPIGMIYDDLMDHLSATHEVIPFGFDWRRPIEEEARRLADAVSTALDAREANQQPVRLIAHSMGGVLARTMQLERPQVWQRLMARDGGRLLMLGTPNGGSWAPMQVLSGDDNFGNALAAFGAPFQDHKARQLMAAMPGFLQLQADLLDERQGLAQASTWQRLARDDLQRVREASWWHSVFGADGNMSQLSAYEWGLPPQAVLDQALALRRRLDQQREQSLPEFAAKMLLVTGHARFTPDGWQWTDEGLVYLDAVDGGDGRVTLASALLPGVRTWTLDAEHGSLPDHKAAFDAFTELLLRGDTTRLPRLGAQRSAADAATPAQARPVTHVASRPSRGQLSGARPADSMKSVLALAQASAPQAAELAATALHVSVLNGNLKFVGLPVMLGHYRSERLSGTEWVLDQMVGGHLQASIDANLYPDAPGTHQIFLNTQRDPLNPWRAPRPLAAIVVGLGAEGDLSLQALTLTVRQGALAWAQRQAESQATPATSGQGAPASADLVATLIGSGGLGISPGAAACAIAQGVYEANQRLAASGWPVINHLSLVELYLDRATEAWRSLQVQAAATPSRYLITPTIASGTGPLRRQLDSAYRGVDHDLIIAETQGADAGPDSGVIAYRLDTRRARTEVRAMATQAGLVRNLVARASNDANSDPQIGRTLFQLLVPPEVEPYLGGTDRMVLELDAGTAGIPWEMLDLPRAARGGGDHRPWAVRCKLLRKLRSKQFRAQVQDADADDAVLVIGEPRIDDARYGALPGALAEAQAVSTAFQSDAGVAADQLCALLGGADASTILNALLARRYRIVHIAGHGEPGASGGVVLSDHTMLGPREIAAMRTVPELVFVNCCHLAATDNASVLRPLDRAAFAAGVAEQLIQIGVRCVIAAGWAVEDEPAMRFATRLYRELLAGQRFIDAVAIAREEAWLNADGGNTWAAYQCYGDPDWRFRRRVGDAQSAPAGAAAADAISSAPDLTLALETVATLGRYHGQDRTHQSDQLTQLESRFAAVWGGIGAVAEAFGVAWAEAGDLDRAISWYTRALACNDASASLKVEEQCLNLQVRRAWGQSLTDPAARAGARQTIADALAEMDRLAQRRPTPEMHSLRGSAAKRLAMLATMDGQMDRKSLALAASAYQAATQAARSRGDPDFWYPAMNLLAVEASMSVDGKQAPDRSLVAEVRLHLQERLSKDPDFWSVVGAVELDLWEGLADKRLAAVVSSLQARFSDVHQRAATPWLWRSVFDQAVFVLTPHLDSPRAADAAAAADLLTQLAGFAEANFDLARQKSLGAHWTASMSAAQTKAADVVIWHPPSQRRQAQAIAKALLKQGVGVWLRGQAKRIADRLPELQRSLQSARLALVLPGPKAQPDDDLVPEEWALLQESAWRRADPVELVALVSGRTPLPAFLEDARRLDEQALAKGGDDAAAQVMQMLHGRQEAPT